jgi:hypothetical protein
VVYDEKEIVCGEMTTQNFNPKKLAAFGWFLAIFFYISSSKQD